LNPKEEYRNSIVNNWRVAMGAKRAQIGMKPLQRDSGPSSLTVFIRQSDKPV